MTQVVSQVKKNMRLKSWSKPCNKNKRLGAKLRKMQPGETISWSLVIITTNGLENKPIHRQAIHTCQPLNPKLQRLLKTKTERNRNTLIKSQGALAGETYFNNWLQLDWLNGRQLLMDKIGEAPQANLTFGKSQIYWLITLNRLKRSKEREWCPM